MAKKPYPILVFCDGASSGNPGPSGWGAIVVDPAGHVKELGGRASLATNNQMELMGAISGLREAEHLAGPLDLWTDSTYVIRGITQWIWAWRSKGWVTQEGQPVSNQDEWKELLRIVTRRNQDKVNAISWKYVRGHQGCPGNERVDEIAVLYSRGKRPSLFDGPLLSYGVAIHDLPESGEMPEMRPRAEKKTALSYLSLLGGTAMRHKTWAECERRVKGQSGAKFKKAMSSEDEQAILAAWGISARDLVEGSH